MNKKPSIEEIIQFSFDLSEINVTQEEIERERRAVKNGATNWKQGFSTEEDSKKIQEAKDGFMRRHGMVRDFRGIDWNHTPETAELKKRYDAKLREEASEPEEMSETTLKKRLARYAEIEARKVGKKFIWDEMTKDKFKNLFWYFCNDPRSRYPLKKGLCLTGAPGVGKTMFMRIFQNFVRNVIPHSGNRFKMASCRDVYKDFVFGQYQEIEKYIKGNWCFDDLGQEELIYKHYGNDICVMEQILFYRDKEFEKGHVKTLITTNCKKEKLEEKYGSRIVDRLEQMVSFVKFEGESKRK